MPLNLSYDIGSFLRSLPSLKNKALQTSCDDMSGMKGYASFGQGTGTWLKIAIQFEVPDSSILITSQPYSVNTCYIMYKP